MAFAWMTIARPASGALLIPRRGRCILTPVSSYSSSSSSAAPARKLVLYSKPGCCLCDGLKEKLQAAFLLTGPHSLQDVDLQVRDITTNPEWERAYQYEIPVLAKVLSDGSEMCFLDDVLLKELFDICTRMSLDEFEYGVMEIVRKYRQDNKHTYVGIFLFGLKLAEEPLPRLSPRLGVELIQKKLASALL